MWIDFLPLNHGQISFYMQKVIFTLYLLFFFSYLSNAQILKVDKGDIIADTSYWAGSINFKLNINNQSATATENITFVGTNLGADLSYIGEKHLYLLINKLRYFTSGTGPFVSTGYAHLRVNWMRQNILSYENFAQVQYDRGRNMPWRGLIGGGTRIRIHKAKKSYFHVGVGAMFEQERWKTFESTTIEKNIWKVNTYIGQRSKFNETTSLHTTVYYQGGYDNEDDVFRNRISGDIALTFGITKALAFEAELSVQYEDKPIIDINNFVYTLSNGVVLSF